MSASVKTSDVWFITSPVMRCQNPVKRWEISKAIPDTLLFLSFSQFWLQTRKPRIPDEEFQSDTPWSPKPRKFNKRREISNVGWSQELTEVLTATHVATLQFDSCAEKDSLLWNSHDGPEFDMFWSMPWCSFPRQKLLPRLTQKKCYTVYSQNLIHEPGDSNWPFYL